MSIPELLDDVSRSLAVLQKSEERFAHLLAPRFRIFDYLRDDEYGLSHCLMDLLDPSGPHGQGRLFLDGFLELLKLPKEGDFEDFKGIHIEHTTERRRRIDLLIHFENALLGIENKPFAGDQDLQLDDYASYLERIADGDHWVLAFLSNRDPSEFSISEKRRKELSEQGNFQNISFRDIEEWLISTARQSQCLTVRIFTEELARHIRHNINGELDMTEEKEIIECMRSSDERLAAAIQVGNTVPELKIKLMTAFGEQLIDEVNKENMFFLEKGGKSLSTPQGSCGFDIAFADHQDAFLRFEFESTSFGYFFWGIKTMIDGRDVEPERKQAINRVMSEAYSSEQSTPYWAWWKSADQTEALGGELHHWNSSPKPWILINRGKLAEKIVNIASHVRHTFAKDLNLLQAQHR